MNKKISFFQSIFSKKNNKNLRLIYDSSGIVHNATHSTSKQNINNNPIDTLAKTNSENKKNLVSNTQKTDISNDVSSKEISINILEEIDDNKNDEALKEVNTKVYTAINTNNSDIKANNNSNILINSKNDIVYFDLDNHINLEDYIENKQINGNIQNKKPNFPILDLTSSSESHSEKENQETELDKDNKFDIPLL